MNALLLILPFCLSVNCAKVLLVPIQTGSHMLEMIRATQELQTYGHPLYMVVSDVTSVPDHIKDTTINVIRYKTFGNTTNKFEMSEYIRELVNMSMYDIERDAMFSQSILSISKTMLDQCYEMMGDGDLLRTLESMQFDLAVTDHLVISPCSSILPYSLSIPFITLGSDFNPYIHAAPLLPSFCPHSILALSDKMSFTERLFNTLFTGLLLMNPALPGMADTGLLRKYGRGRGDLDRPIYEITREGLLSLLNIDPILSHPMPVMPRTKFVGGLTTRPVMPLSGDLENIIESSENDVIVVSFGSIVNVFPEEITRKFVEAFSRVKYTIIWRYNGTVSHKLSKNTFIRKWLPQNDILGHPRTKLFITHSGNNGQFEALYHGVPMLCFYLWGDQVHNAHRVEHKGFGLKIKITEFSSEEMVKAIIDLLTNDSYRVQIQKASKIYRDRPMTAPETSAFWIDHVIKYGSEHLKSAATELNWYSYFMIDIFLLLFLLIVVVVTLVCYCIRCLKRSIDIRDNNLIKKNK